MTSSKSYLLLLALLALATSTYAVPTIHDIVNKFGFPSGIVPDSVESYSANEVDGSFAIYLKKPCYVKYDYLVHFDTEITGKISYGQITELKGLKSPVLGLVTVMSDIALYVPIPTCKDKALTACDHSSKLISQLPVIAE
ncbi:uncharacterized protein LOC143572079 [Bidens hawaiensis]|uniref:uncharacterized protein LOC143572079 n=1 Tax=Bidens hawaiensis TaxID=980011 RepID=UPI00404B4050